MFQRKSTSNGIYQILTNNDYYLIFFINTLIMAVHGTLAKAGKVKK